MIEGEAARPLTDADFPVEARSNYVYRCDGTSFCRCDDEQTARRVAEGLNREHAQRQ